MAAQVSSTPGSTIGGTAGARAAVLLRRALPLAGVAFFAVAIWALHEALPVDSYRDLVDALGALPRARLALALAITVAGYAVLVGYDLIALRHLGERVPLRDAAGAALLAGALGNNLGNTLLTGSAVRFWLYTAVGLSAPQITRLVLLCSLGFWLGYALLGALFFLAAPLALPPALQWIVAGTRPLGVLCALALLGWIALCARGRELRLRRWRLRLPSLRLTVAQIAVASADLGLMAGAAYVLLPTNADLDYAAFMSVFLIALVAGNASQVPGGLGVFEAVVVLLLGPRLDSRALFAALLAFRAIYLLMPLIVAAAVVSLRGGLRLAPAGSAWLGRGVRTLAGAAPHVLAGLAFVSGAVLLMSGALPAAVGRLAIVQRLFALPLIEASHFVASLVGAALLVVARGLQRRLDAAWLIACGLLGAGALLSLLKGWDYEEASLLGIALLALLPVRRQFYRRSSLLDTAFAPAWMASFLIVLGATAGLTLFAHRQAAWAAQPWWEFAWHAEASRSLRAAVGAVGLFMLFALHRLIRPPPAEAPAPAGAELERARPLVERSPWTYANLVYRADKSLLFSAAGDAFLMYGRQGRSWIAMGDPVGTESGARELVWRFHELSDRSDGWCVFFEARPQRRALYAELGLSLTPLGEEARVELAWFTLDTPAHRDLRQARARLLRGGWRFEILPPEAVPAVLPTLAAISRAWLERKATHEKGFSNASFEGRYLSRFPIALVRRGGEISAFANLWLGAGHEELSVDLMRHRPDAPGGAMDFLFAELLQWGRAQGFAWFNFGMTPLAGLEAQGDVPLWSRVGSFVYRHAEHFYNFEGLRRYKAKFDPVWTPLYLASPGGLALAPILVDVTALIAGGLGGIVSKRTRPTARRTA
jgi:phosphatidylglycerol lysyltransferase